MTRILVARLWAVAFLSMASLAVAQGLPSLRYDAEYPVIGYSGAASSNPVARLQARLDSGAVKLQFEPSRGYLLALLRALDIDVSSQVLVYSKTSLQVSAISAATPRAIYFNADTYVAWVQGTGMMEIAVMDSALGLVFYTLQNHEPGKPLFDREGGRCLQCHDTFSMLGGGVPRFIALSAPVSVDGFLLPQAQSIQVTDKTPLGDRWGGWYVTGDLGTQRHLGNIQMTRSAADKLPRPMDVDKLRSGSLASVAPLFDVQPYPSDKSDVVALLVFEHQGQVQNMITRAGFKVRTVLSRQDADAARVVGSWEDLSPRNQAALKAMIEPIVHALLFVDEAPLAGRIRGTSGFETWFQAQAPRDSQGRSLRDLDLTRRVFRYPLSYMIYSEAFDGLPQYALDYIYSRLEQILKGRDSNEATAGMSGADRQAAFEILMATKPAFARHVARMQHEALSDAAPRVGS